MDIRQEPTDSTDWVEEGTSSDTTHGVTSQ